MYGKQVIVGCIQLRAPDAREPAHWFPGLPPLVQCAKQHPPSPPSGWEGGGGGRASPHLMWQWLHTGGEAGGRLGLMGLAQVDAAQLPRSAPRNRHLCVWVRGCRGEMVSIFCTSPCSSPPPRNRHMRGPRRFERVVCTPQCRPQCGCLPAALRTPTLAVCGRGCLGWAVEGQGALRLLPIA